MIFQMKSSNRKRLDNLLSFIKSMVDERDYLSMNTVFSVIKIFTDKINSGNCIDILCGGMFGMFVDDNITDITAPVKLERPIEILLGKDPVITYVNNKEKLVQCLNNIGVGKNEWIQDTSHTTNRHTFNLFLPMGLTEITSGNLSVSCGITKGIGTLTYDPSDKNVFDISHLYDEIYFDGNCYREIDSNRKKKDVPFEYGCIFEIGRVIKESNISFLSLKYRENG